MPRPLSKTLTEAERRIMDVLWRRGEASVRTVADDLSEEKPVAYNSVLTILGILHKKKYVGFRRDGRAHIYRPVVSQANARQEALENLVTGFFGGSKNAFAQYLLDEDQIDVAGLKKLKSLVGAKRTKKSEASK